MAKNSIDAYGALGKSNLLFFDPEDLVLVTDEKSPLFDQRVHLPLSEPMVLNIMHQGVVQPITVAKNTETGKVEVVAGRQRVKNAREANKRLKAQGCELIQVPAVAKRADAVALTGVMVSENELREADTPLGRAHKMAKLGALGRSEEQLAILFGCSEQTVRNSMALLDCVAGVRNAVDAGKIGVGHALKLQRLEPTEQREKLAELLEAANGSNGHAKARKQRAVVGGQRMRSRKEVLAECGASTGDRKAALAWVLDLRPA